MSSGLSGFVALFGQIPENKTARVAFQQPLGAINKRFVRSSRHLYAAVRRDMILC